PIPAGWDDNLRRLPEVHRRFAVAQNFAVGGVILFCGAIAIAFAPVLVTGSTGGRILSAGIALWWGARFVILPWLGVRPQLATKWLKVGYRLLQLQCALYALAFGWLAVR
ncbi:MAG TPA: hypothetical protein VHF69_01575, partial [Candidatus Synoicihabitans sp.]|nr:hypothetical protein [Candidatus Synoicihabitans sp.]